MRVALTLGGLLLLAACKPPPTDAGMDRALPEAAPTYASDPLPSPDSEGAMWVASAKDAERIIYGVPGEPALLSLACLSDGDAPRIRITRNSPADEGAGAMLAMVGNGAIGRVPVDATEVAGKSVWQGEILAADSDLDPLAGPRQLTATIPGAGTVTLNPSPLPMELIRRCRES